VSQILVAFATKNGSTEEVAGAIATALRGTGCTVTLRRAREVKEPIRGSDLVVLGAPLYSGRWHRDAHRFLKSHRDELGSVPIAVFGMGPRSGEEEGWRRSRAQLDRALAKRPWLSPVAVAVFGGVDPPRGRRERRDLRDWTVIGGWAAQLAPRPGASTAPPPETTRSAV
jgi:menaquinone-dependent protoporphyrinogen oxidase